MAAILSKPRQLILRIDSDSFTKLSPSGKGEFRHPVQDGKYPRSGLEHPAIGIGDHIEFTIVDNVIVHNAAGKFVVTDIDLARNQNYEWDWVVKFSRLN